MRRSQAELQYVGRPAVRVDALEKVLGTARYVGDLRLPGMLHARVLRSPLPHARITRLDVTQALAVPGVLAAITCNDFVDHGRFGFPVKDIYMLAYQRARYVGDGLAAIAAETEEALETGLAAILLELEPLPAIFDPAAALVEGAPVIGEHPWDTPELPRGNLLARHIVREGDPEAMLADCPITLDEQYGTGHQEHAYLETEGALAIPRPDGHGVTVYSSCQSPYICRNNVAHTLGLRVEDVRVIQPPVGGAFGGKDDLNYQTAGQVAGLALLSGRPVRMTFGREESMIASYKRDAMTAHVRLGADRDGTLRAGKVRLIVDSGGYASTTPFTAWRSSIHAMGPYRYGACHVDTDVAYTNNGYSGAFRGFGNTEVCAAIEQAIDELAYKLNVDPLVFRLRNCLRPGDTTPHGQALGTDVAIVECLERVREASDWDRKRREYSASKPTWSSYGGPAEPGFDRLAQVEAASARRGIGVAAMFHGMSLGAEGADYAVTTLAINDDYSLALATGLTDYGPGSRTVYTLIAAETLGLRPERFRMPRPDTELPVESGPTVASRATVLGGNATRIAAQRLDDQLIRAAADLLRCEAAQVLRDGENYVGPSEEPVPFEAIVDHARQLGASLSAQGRWEAPENHWSFETGRGKPYFAYHFGAQVAEVAVDTGTGKVDVIGLWAAHNTGKVIFPQGADGQVYGGMAQGLGYGLMEQIHFDQGYLQETNFDEYLIPTALDVPEMVSIFVEKPFQPGPFGAKNVAEPAMVPTAPAILNAIFHATGRRVRHLPATLERVLLGYDLRKEGSDRACKLGLSPRR
jgi:CO/xanthine dehydrogenase Mo-binding subunit